MRFEVGLSYDDGNRFDTRPDAPITGSLDLNQVDPTQLDVNMIVNLPVENGLYPTALYVYGKLTVGGNGVVSSMIFEIDGTDVGQATFRGGSNTAQPNSGTIPF